MPPTPGPSRGAGAGGGAAPGQQQGHGEEGGAGRPPASALPCRTCPPRPPRSADVRERLPCGLLLQPRAAQHVAAQHHARPRLRPHPRAPGRLPAPATELQPVPSRPVQRPWDSGQPPSGTLGSLLRSRLLPGSRGGLSLHLPASDSSAGGESPRRGGSHTAATAPLRQAARAHAQCAPLPQALTPPRHTRPPGRTTRGSTRGPEVGARPGPRRGPARARWAEELTAGGVCKANGR